jgi:hypothetical protein
MYMILLLLHISTSIAVYEIGGIEKNKRAGTSTDEQQDDISGENPLLFL